VATHGLIDTTEMYLRTVYELTEERIVPLRARIAERLGQSGPTVSETVARMERDGLLRLADGRRLALTEEGLAQATRVMRKHRLAECLLVDVIGLPWEEVHIEACRWEHVISEAVERRLAELLGFPIRCPHGNVIPGLGELGVPEAVVVGASAAAREPDASMTAVAGAADGARQAGEAGPGRALVTVRRISEQLQSDVALMHKLKNFGIQPGCEVTLVADGDDVRVTGAGRVGELSAALPREVAEHVFVVVLAPASRAQADRPPAERAVPA
jgi:DtxR family Mn-dependent transcriptional regulator